MNITAALHQSNTGLHCKFHQISFSEHVNNKIFLYFNLYCKTLKRTRTLHLSIKFTVGQSFCYFTLCLFFHLLMKKFSLQGKLHNNSLCVLWAVRTLAFFCHLENNTFLKPMSFVWCKLAAEILKYCWNTFPDN